MSYISAWTVEVVSPKVSRLEHTVLISVLSMLSRHTITRYDLILIIALVFACLSHQFHTERHVELFVV